MSFTFNDRPYKISGKRSGPPPKRGPNPQVPPIRLSKHKVIKLSKKRGN